MKILIAYPKELINKRYFLSKLGNILKNQSDFTFNIYSDPNGYIQEEWSGLKNTILKGKNRGHARAAVDSSTHAIIFWDGIEFCDLIYFCNIKKTPLRLINLKLTKVCNKDRGEYFDTYIGRGTPWGNPFPIGENGDNRDDVIKKYRNYFNSEIISNEEKRRELLSLRGKILGCHCKPLACHGDVIAEYLNALDDNEINLV